MNKKIRAFSLLELSIVLIIIGILIGSSITLVTVKLNESKVSITGRKLAKIEKALLNFVVENRRLPCPANGNDIINATIENSFGLEGTPNPTPTPQCGDSNFNDGTIYSGVVPVKTLGLNYEDMMDGWGRRISYIVDSRFALNENLNGLCDGAQSTNCFYRTAEGTIEINDLDGVNIRNNATYVLISHGNNGNGAFNYYGSGRLEFPGTYHPKEFENSGDQNPYDDIFVQDDAVEGFDDIVKYKDKSEIISAAKLSMNPDTCNAARNVVINAGVANSCSNANNATLCENMALRVSELCLE